MKARVLACGALLGVALILTATPATGQFMNASVNLAAYLGAGDVPRVVSTASAQLYDSHGTPMLGEIIFGHQIYEATYVTQLSNIQYTTQTGNAYAHVVLGPPDAQSDLCYWARVAAHNNLYYQHLIYYTPTSCIPEPPPPNNCPVLIDLGLDGFALSGPQPPVSFDIDGDGAPQSIAWTASNTNDAFLCMDRNHNGTIDDGTELFGFGTPMPDGSTATIGYRALAVLDELAQGGNHDGRIDSQDAAFTDLCVWTDVNRNGVSEPAEIRRLADTNVLALGFDYRTISVSDRFGNSFRYVSHAWMRGRNGQTVAWPTYDVVFANAPATP